MDLVDGVVLVVHSMGNSEKAGVRWYTKSVIQFLRLDVGFETSISGIHLTDGLLKGLLERPSDGHDFSDGLHRRTNLTVDLRRELGEVPFWNLGDDVIQRWFETCRSGLGDGVW